MAKNVFFLSFGLFGIFLFLAFAFPQMFLPAGLLLVASVLAFASHLFNLLEQIVSNLREGVEAQVESSRCLNRAEKAAEAERKDKLV